MEMSVCHKTNQTNSWMDRNDIGIDPHAPSSWLIDSLALVY